MVEDEHLGGDILEHARDAFAQTIALKVSQLRRYVPRARAVTNTDLTGKYIEELVRGFIRAWIGDKRLLHGTFFSRAEVDSVERPLQIDGIVHDPSRGPVILKEGEFAIVHPAFCAGVIEIKMTTDSISGLHSRLRDIHTRYMSHLPTTNVMAVVLADRNPDTTSFFQRPDGTSHPYHDYNTVPYHPIFILFEETESGDYNPFMPGIDAMIRAVYTQLHATTNYLH